MYRFFIALLIALTFSVASAQSYTIRSVSGHVIIDTAGKHKTAAAGSRLRNTDCLIIPANGFVEIHNPLDNKIYKSVSTGYLAVGTVMAEAQKAATDNGGNIGARFNFGKSSGSEPQKLYAQKGLVTRALSVFDPESAGSLMDNDILSEYVVASIRNKSDDSDLPIEFSHESLNNGGLRFSVFNNMDVPVYFNVIRISGSDTPQVEISQLGQPEGTYVLLPNQSLQREHRNALSPTDHHLLVLTPLLFDINSLLNAVAAKLSQNQNLKENQDIPIFVRPL